MVGYRYLLLMQVRVEGRDIAELDWEEDSYSIIYEYFCTFVSFNAVELILTEAVAPVSENKIVGSSSPTLPYRRKV